MKILAVDDDEIALALLKETLVAGGYNNMVLAHSGEDALRIMNSSPEPFDCFLLDIVMPGIDGIEMCRRIRAMTTYKTTPIVMITAMSDRSYVDRAFAAGALDYINKPFDPLEIHTRLRMSNNLRNEQQATVDSMYATSAIKAKLEDSMRFSFDDAIKIEDVPGAIEKLAMENYLLQMSRGKLAQTTAIGFTIAEAEHIFRKSTVTEIVYTLTDIADAISMSLKRSDYFLSYCGRGNFVCTISRDADIVADGLEQEIQWNIDEMELAYDNGEPCPVTMLMGEPTTASMWTAKNGLKLMETALISAEQKRVGGQTVHRFQNTEGKSRFSFGLKGSRFA